MLATVYKPDAWVNKIPAYGSKLDRRQHLRHQYASFLVNSGRTLYEVQQILGHSDPKVTQRYSPLSSKALQDAANSASIIIRGALQPVSKVLPLQSPGAQQVASGTSEPDGSGREVAHVGA